MILLAHTMPKKIIKIITAKIKKIKIFDWLLITFGLVSVIIFTVIFFRKSTFITATISVGDSSVVYGTFFDSGPKPWFANTFYRGQSEKDGLGRIQAEILDVFAYDVAANHKTVYLDVKLNSVYNRATGTYTYKGIPILVGSTIKLNLDKVFAEGLVTRVQGFPNYTAKKIITIETQIREDNVNYPGTIGTKNYLADALQVGDTIKDNNGLVLIKILDKKVTPAEITVNTSDGRAVSTQDPVKKDVFLTLEVLAERIDDKYYFLDNIPILIDHSIPLNTPVVSVFPIVTKFLTY